MSIALIAAVSILQGSTDSLDRTVLPIHLPKADIYTELDVRNIKEVPKRHEIVAPKGAPNILLILIDDMGFGVSNTFGGPAQMPTIDALAQSGIRYNHFHTTSLCAPTRAALMSGRNHHANNMGAITEMATAFPGNTGSTPPESAPIAKVLRYNGFSTAMFGKNHETAAWEVSPSGPTDRWPTRKGFDKFYGFFGGETNQWAPLIYDGMSPVEIPENPDYNFMTDMTDKAIEWVSFQQALTPDKPFFLYFAPGATHAPHHVPQKWIEKYKGKFDQGWDKLREETLTRQIKQGIVPEGTKLAPKPDDIKDWDTLSVDEKRLFARQMETFAGFAEYADTEIGRLVQKIEDMGELDNTLVIYIAGDNGTSAEGGMNGVFNEYTALNGVVETVEEQLKYLDQWGNPKTYPHMAAGWAIASGAPFAWAKQVAGDFGGTRNGMVMRWPKNFKDSSKVRSQFGHVTDIVPTILEATKIPAPKTVDGIEQLPIHGKSLLYTFNEPEAAEKHTSQYFEMFANRGYYKDGWFARVLHRKPWSGVPDRSLQDDIWELFDTKTDFSLAHNIADKHPEKLKELQDAFMKDASIYHALPLDDRSYDRLNAALAGRPDLMGGRTSITLADGMKDLGENVFINVKNISHSVDADILLTEGKKDGVIIAQGGRFGGWVLFVKDGRPAYTYNFLGREYTTVLGKEALPSGTSNIRLEFKYDGGGVGKGGIATLFVNKVKVDSKRVEKTQPTLFSMDETADVGIDGATPVDESYAANKGKFSGKVLRVTVAVESKK